jgi:hypothetical protein
MGAAARRDLRLEQGCDAEGALRAVLAPEGPSEADAALLQVVGMGLPLDLETMRRTRLAVESRLTRDGFLHRYRMDDGLQGSEGAFLACNFWHVDALLAEGDLDAAVAKFETLLSVANDVGLYAEEYDARSRRFLGNFPQAFTHSSLVNSAVAIELCRERGPQAIRGGYAKRAQRYAKATLGLRGALAALLHHGRLRVRSSRRSQLDPSLLRSA